MGRFIIPRASLACSHMEGGGPHIPRARNCLPFPRPQLLVRARVCMHGTLCGCSRHVCTVTLPTMEEELPKKFTIKSQDEALAISFRVSGYLILPADEVTPPPPSAITSSNLAQPSFLLFIGLVWHGIEAVCVHSLGRHMSGRPPASVWGPLSNALWYPPILRPRHAIYILQSDHLFAC